MFPAPQTSLPLPPRPDLQRYRKLAKELVKACELATLTGDAGVIREWARGWVNSLIQLCDLRLTRDLPVAPDEWVDGISRFAMNKMKAGSAEGSHCSLSKAHFVIARSHGFAGWPRFVRAVEECSIAGSAQESFEKAVDSIVHGDVQTLRRLLGQQPTLIHQRSLREHEATLLHYTAANGVEGYRQKTPPNTIEVARILLAAGADIDATGRMYGSPQTTLELAATSVHPERAGVIEELLSLLLEQGASIGPTTSGDRSIVDLCLANGRLRAAVFLAGHGARTGLAAAAGIGNRALLRNFFNQDGTLRPGAKQAQVEQGFLYASQYGQKEIIEELLEHGVNIQCSDHNGQTALHWACHGGYVDIVRALLKHGASVEAVNTYGGTPMGQALWSAYRSGVADHFPAVLHTLVDAGAELPARCISVSPVIDEWMRRRGVKIEPAGPLERQSQDAV